MIQKGTLLNILDNSGAKIGSCIHVYGGYRKQYAKIGDIVLVSIKSTRKKNEEDLKINKGEMTKALVISTKVLKNNIRFSSNNAILLTSQNKYMGTRIFGPVIKEFRYTKYIKMLSMSSGVVN